MDSGNNPFTSEISQLCHHLNGRTLQTSLNYESSVSFFCCLRHQRSQPDFVSKGKKELMPFIFPSGSVPRWRFPATFQLHYRDLCWDYDKNTCFLQFQSDQGHFSRYFFFFAITYQSSTWQADLPLFKQLTSLAARKALDLNLASPRRHVFFITFQPIMYTRHPVHLEHVMMTFWVYTGTVECFHRFD